MARRRFAFVDAEKRARLEIEAAVKQLLSEVAELRDGTTAQLEWLRGQMADEVDRLLRRLAHREGAFGWGRRARVGAGLRWNASAITWLAGQGKLGYWKDAAKAMFWLAKANSGADPPDSPVFRRPQLRCARCAGSWTPSSSGAWPPSTAPRARGCCAARCPAGAASLRASRSGARRPRRRLRGGGAAC